MLKTTSHEKNRNQNQEGPLYTHQDGYYQMRTNRQNTRKYVLVMTWGNWNPCVFITSGNVKKCSHYGKLWHFQTVK